MKLPLLLITAAVFMILWLFQDSADDEKHLIGSRPLMAGSVCQISKKAIAEWYKYNKILLCI